MFPNLKISAAELGWKIGKKSLMLVAKLMSKDLIKLLYYEIAFAFL